MSDEDVELNTRGLDSLLKAMKGQEVTAKVGILGSDNVRSGKGSNSNAVVGAAHEFGTTTLPQRSFLRVPISENLGSALENANAFDKDTLDRVVKEGSMKGWVEKVAILAVSIVNGAFNSSGYGKWRPSIMTRKKTKQTLVETGQLRDSITYEVK